MKKYILFTGLGLLALSSLCSCRGKKSEFSKYTLSRYSDEVKACYREETITLNSYNDEESVKGPWDYTLKDFAEKYNNIYEVSYSSLDTFYTAFYIKDSVIEEMQDYFGEDYKTEFTGNYITDGRLLEMLGSYKNIKDEDYYLVEFNEEKDIVDSIDDYSFSGLFSSMTYTMTNAKTKEADKNTYPYLFLADHLEYIKEYAGTTRMRTARTSDYPYATVQVTDDSYYGGKSYFGEIKTENDIKYLYCTATTEDYLEGTEYEKLEETTYKVLWSSIYQ